MASSVPSSVGIPWAARSRTVLSSSTISSESMTARASARHLDISISDGLVRKRSRSSVRRHSVKISALDTPRSIRFHSSSLSGRSRTRRRTHRCIHIIKHRFLLALFQQKGHDVDIRRCRSGDSHAIRRGCSRRGFSDAQRLRLLDRERSRRPEFSRSSTAIVSPRRTARMYSLKCDFNSAMRACFMTSL